MYMSSISPNPRAPPTAMLMKASPRVLPSAAGPKGATVKAAITPTRTSLSGIMVHSMSITEMAINRQPKSHNDPGLGSLAETEDDQREERGSGRLHQERAHGNPSAAETAPAPQHHVAQQGYQVQGSQAAMAVVTTGGRADDGLAAWYTVYDQTKKTSHRQPKEWYVLKGYRVQRGSRSTRAPALLYTQRQIELSTPEGLRP